MTLAPDINDLVTEIDAIEIEEAPEVRVPQQLPPKRPTVVEMLDEILHAMRNGDELLDAGLAIKLWEASQEDPMVASEVFDRMATFVRNWPRYAYPMVALLRPLFPALRYLTPPHAAARLLPDCCSPSRGRMLAGGDYRGMRW